MVLAKSGFSEGLDTAWADAAEILPKIGYFLLILIVGIIVAKVIAKLVTSALQRVGFDRVVERGGVKQALSQSKYDAAAILGKIVYYFIFLGVLSMAFAVFGTDNPISVFIASIVAFLPKLFVAVVALIIAFAVAAAVKDLLQNLLGGLSYGGALANAVSLFIIALGVFFALDQLEIAPLIVGGVFYALLALIVLPLIIAFGVGGIEPARETIRNLQASARQKAREVKAEAQRDDDDAPAPRRTRSASTTRSTRRPRGTS
jgi:hypothetical protein